MIIYPAIDIKQGKVVRLLYGDMNKATIYHHDAAEQAMTFINAGFSHIHVVDLDGAIAGHPVNKSVIYEILRQTNVNIQIGGGIRELSTIEDYLFNGAARVVIGTKAVKDDRFLSEATRKFPHKIALALDCKNGVIATNGWLSNADLTPAQILQRISDYPLSSVIFTDISRDGSLKGINLPAIKEVIEATTIPVIASGGVSALGDLVALNSLPKLKGVIIGRAFYEKAFTFKQALEVCNA